jgi:hypothetical protein
MQHHFRLATRVAFTKSALGSRSLRFPHFYVKTVNLVTCVAFRWSSFEHTAAAVYVESTAASE